MTGPQEQAKSAIAKQQAAQAADSVSMAHHKKVVDQLTFAVKELEDALESAAAEREQIERDSLQGQRQLEKAEDQILSLRADVARLEAQNDQRTRMINGLQATIELQAGRLTESQEVITGLIAQAEETE